MPLYISPPIASIMVVVLLWTPIFVVIFPGWIYTSNLSEVFLFQGCIRWSMHTMFVIFFSEIVIAAHLLKFSVSPVIFGKEIWTSFNHSKQQVFIIRCIIIISAASCFFLLVISVAPQLHSERRRSQRVTKYAIQTHTPA